MRAGLARRPESAKSDQLWVIGARQAPNQLGSRDDHAPWQEAQRHRAIARAPRQAWDRSASADLGAAVGEIGTLAQAEYAGHARRYAGQALNRQGAQLMVQDSPPS
jgi:propanediol dehydratase large subunit